MNSLGSWAVVALLALVGGPLGAEPSAAPAVAVRGMDDLVRMDRPTLEALYRGAEVGTTPTGFARGKAIYNPGSRLTVPASRVVHVLWQGKVFQDDGTMVNRVLGLKAVQARVYVGESWLDGAPSLVLDYCGTSRVYADVRDEVREICPGLYLGIMYRRRDTGPELATFFALDTRQQAEHPRGLFHRR